MLYQLSYGIIILFRTPFQIIAFLKSEANIGLSYVRCKYKKLNFNTAYNCLIVSYKHRYATIPWHPPSSFRIKKVSNSGVLLV